jgi:hypothetical protein
MCVAMVVAVMIALAVAMAVITDAALRLGHACQHARADPLQHIDNDQPAAPA